MLTNNYNLNQLNYLLIDAHTGLLNVVWLMYIPQVIVVVFALPWRRWSLEEGETAVARHQTKTLSTALLDTLRSIIDLSVVNHSPTYTQVISIDG